MGIDLKAMDEDFGRLDDGNLDDLDEIVSALQGYLGKHPPRTGGIVMPNRVIALAAVRLTEAWDKAIWEHD